MASINGMTPGYRPRGTPKKRAKPTAAPKFPLCSYCGGKVQNKKDRWIGGLDDRMICPSCQCLFQIHAEQIGPPAPFNIEVAKERIAGVRESKYALILTNNSFGCGGGATVNVEMGDVFPVARVGLLEDEFAFTNNRRTRAMFSIDIKIGPELLTLFPHEFSPMTFLTIMSMRKAGELTEEYVSVDDDSGYFAPVPELRAEIQQLFGRGI